MEGKYIYKIRRKSKIEEEEEGEEGSGWMGGGREEKER